MDNMTIYREAIEKIHDKLLRNGAKFDSVSPYIYADGGIYKISDGTNWTDSLYTGMLCLGIRDSNTCAQCLLNFRSAVLSGFARLSYLRAFLRCNAGKDFKKTSSDTDTSA